MVIETDAVASDEADTLGMGCWPSFEDVETEVELT